MKTDIVEPGNERSIDYVEHCESPKSGNHENQPEGSQRRHSGDWKIEYVVEEDCGGSEKEIAPA